jgi:hypothetical protein
LKAITRASRHQTASLCTKLWLRPPKCQSTKDFSAAKTGSQMSDEEDGTSGNGAVAAGPEAGITFKVASIWRSSVRVADDEPKIGSRETGGQYRAQGCVGRLCTR